MRTYLMEQGFLNQLLSDRKELFTFARELGSAEAMRAARADLMAQTRINITPKNRDELSRAYTVDSEGVAHIDVVGELTPAAQTDACGAYTAQALTEYGFIQAAVNGANLDERVNSILLHVNTPGGYADYCDDTALVIKNSTKPIDSFVFGSMAASAGYWLVSQTRKIILSSPAVSVGSIGVAAEEYDDDEWLKKQGVTHRVYTSTDAPLKRLDTKTEEGRSEKIKYLNEKHNVFASRVAEGRGVSVETVNKDFGRGALVSAEKALAVGMVDEVRGMINKNNSAVGSKKPVVNGTVKTAANGGEIQEVKEDMNLDELKKDHLAAYNEAVQVGVSQGVESERARVNKLRSYIEADPENAKLAEVVNDAMATGKTAADIDAQLQIAIRDGKVEGENPPDVNTDLSAENDDEIVINASVEKLKNLGV